MRLTTRTNLAMRALMFCAVNPGAIVRKSEVASSCNASLNHLGLVINRLGQGGFVTTTRGRNGGMRLALPPEEISVGAVFRYLEADVPFTECLSRDDNTCPLADCCRLSAVLCSALDAFYEALDRITLDDLTRDNTELHRLLGRVQIAA